MVWGGTEGFAAPITGGRRLIEGLPGAPSDKPRLSLAASLLSDADTLEGTGDAKDGAGGNGGNAGAGSVGDGLSSGGRVGGVGTDADARSSACGGVGGAGDLDGAAAAGGGVGGPLTSPGDGADRGNACGGVGGAAATTGIGSSGVTGACNATSATGMVLGDGGVQGMSFLSAPFSFP